MSRSFTHVLTIYLTEDQHDRVAQWSNARRVGMSEIVREALDKHLGKAPPAEAARDDGDGRDSPPSAPVSPSSRVASAGESKHPWRRQGAALAKRPAAMRSRS